MHLPAELTLVLAVFGVLCSSIDARNVASSANNVRHKRSTCSVSSASAFSQAEKDALVQAHNTARSAVQASNMLPMEWDEGLAKMAQYSSDLCIWAHGNTDGCDGKPVGQNIYMTTSMTSTNFNAAVTNWDAEKQWYTLSSNTCSATPPYSCGHHTQVVWADSNKVGCGYKRCPGFGTIVFCNYSPAGNWKGQKPYKTGAACSSCVTSNGVKCNNGLCYNCLPGSDAGCTCSRTCVAGQGTLDSASCTCQCNNGYYGDNCSGVCNVPDLNTAHCTYYIANYQNICSKPEFRKFMETNCYTSCGFANEIPECNNK